MYAGVPTESPVSVSRSRPAVLTARAMPKSATIGSPWWSMMFSGLISRWMTPRACAKSRAEAMARVMRSASFERQLAFPLQALAQAVAFDVRHHIIDVRHHIIEEAVRLPGLDDGQVV